MIYENSLYNGTVTLRFETRRHRYIHEEKNKVIKSVTTANNIIAKPFLIQWAANKAVDYCVEQIAPGIALDELQLVPIWEKARRNHTDYRDYAGKVGTILHNWVEEYINWKTGNVNYKTGEKQTKPPLPVNKKLRKSCRKFLKWVKDHKVKFHVSEQVVFSLKYQYCGTTDFICTIDGKRYIGDLKTSKGIYASQVMQASAYRQAREEEYPKEKYHGQVIVRIGREDGLLEIGYCRGKKDHIMHLKGFLLALGLSDQMEKIENFEPDRV